MSTMFEFSTILLAFLASFNLAEAQWDPNFQTGRNAIVHLFEWKWNDIAKECVRFLGPEGFGGVQVSPPNENAIITSPFRPWWERYQPVSYKLETRSGNETEFINMVKTCNTVGVRIYVDAVINHMTGNGVKGKGTGGSAFDAASKNYSAVPYGPDDFNDQCPTSSGSIEDYGNANQVRNCELSGLRDLNQGKEHVRERIAEYLNRLIKIGVAGFRIDASKHMWPADMKAILDRLNNLPREHGFNGSDGAKPFIVQEVIDLGNEPIKGSDYFGNGRVTEFKYGMNLGEVFRKLNNQKLKYLVNYGEGWAFYPDKYALTFIDNHDNQRGHGAGGANILTFRVPKLYKMATSFLLSWPYGLPRVMSSYHWQQKIEGGSDKNDWIGPPNKDGVTSDVGINSNDNTCLNGWVCEHRWRQIYNMVKFRNAVAGTNMTNWWDNGENQIAFSRGNAGFIAINNDDKPLNSVVKTGLPAGKYCDVISGGKKDNTCTGATITVNQDGTVNLNIPNNQENPVVAIHVKAKL